MLGRNLQLPSILLFVMAIISCGGGGGGSSNSNPSGSGGSSSTSVTYSFSGGTPTAAAVQIGTGTFTSATLQSGKLALSIPQGTTTYAIAFVCPPTAGFGNTVTSEYIIEAAIQDGTAFSLNCGATLTTSNVTGSVDASAVPGAANVLIRGTAGYGGQLGGTTGTFNVTLPNGTNDVAFVAIDSAVQPNVLAVKILRNQTAPGAVNGGNAVVFSSADLTANQSFAVTNIPSGFVTPPAASVEYYTANGTYILLDNNSATQYPAVPAAAKQSGDFYLFEANTSDTATHNSAVGITQTNTTGGSATIALPTQWTYSGPTPAKLPTFTFAYSGYSGLADVAQQAEIEWAPTPTTLTTITVTATTNAQNGATTLAIPDLSSISGFSASAPSGTNVYWVAAIYGGSAEEFSFYPNPPSNGSLAFVQNRGNYTQP
ncbi:MAG TPA: hypothetical protein VKW78_15705 [Terriglobales bacterium]|nr:hypothetical protein [Terriglobales bacterium]